MSDLAKWWGEITGGTQKTAGQQAQAQAQQALAGQATTAGQNAASAGTAAGGMLSNAQESMGKNATEMMQKADLAAKGQAAENATAAAQRNLQAARGAGLNAGQAAQLAAQGTGQAFSQGIEAGRQQYGQNVGQALGAQGQLANQQLGQQQLQTQATGFGGQLGAAQAEQGRQTGQDLWSGITKLAGGVSTLLGKPASFAKGGVVAQPTNAVVGEKGPEVVLPLNDKERMAQILEKIGLRKGAAEVKAMAEMCPTCGQPMKEKPKAEAKKEPEKEKKDAPA